MTLQEVGLRLYIVGNTYPIRDAIKAAGGHWDGDRKQWWIGKTKRTEIESAISKAATGGAAKQEPAEYDGEVQGKASYKGRDYYVRWAGRTGRGTDAFRLVSLDGRLDFWADASACQWTKRYTANRHGSFPTLRGIRRFIEDRRAEQKDGEPRTYAAKQAAVEALEDGDDFDGARRLAQQYGIAY